MPQFNGYGNHGAGDHIFTSDAATGGLMKKQQQAPMLGLWQMYVDVLLMFMVLGL